MVNVDVVISVAVAEVHLHTLAVEEPCRQNVICAKRISSFDNSHKGVGAAAADSLSCSQLAVQKQTGSYID